MKHPPLPFFFYSPFVFIFNNFRKKIKIKISENGKPNKYKEDSVQTSILTAIHVHIGVLEHTFLFYIHHFSLRVLFPTFVASPSLLHVFSLFSLFVLNGPQTDLNSNVLNEFQALQ